MSRVSLSCFDIGNLSQQSAHILSFVFYCFPVTSQCLKTTEKVAYNIASEASYVFNLASFDKLKLPV